MFGTDGIQCSGVHRKARNDVWHGHFGFEFPGACYHMINGGNFRFAVFREDRDRELILEKLVNFAERFLGRYSLSDLAERLGGMTVGGLCATRYKMSRRLQPPEETDLCAAAKGLVRSLAEEHKVTKWD